MHSVSILARFLTGTTVDDYEQARQRTTELLLRRLKEAGIAGEKSTEGIFEVSVIHITSESLLPRPLGEVQPTPRGFEVIRFTDHYGDKMVLMQSSLILGGGNPEPGASAICLGADGEGDLMTLDRKAVESLINHLQAWLHNGSLKT